MKFASSVRNVPLCFLIVTVFLAVPVASQAQTTPLPTQTQPLPTAMPQTQTAVAATRAVVEVTQTAFAAGQQTQAAAQQTMAAARQTLQASRQETIEAQLTAAAQSTPPAVPPPSFPLINPDPTGSDIHSCGLPTRSAAFSSGSVTFGMTADCSFSSGDLHQNAVSILHFIDGGPYTINGNGHSIIGSSGVAAISVGNGVTVNLNNVVIRSSGGAQTPAVRVNGGTLNAVNVVFQDNSGLAVIIAEVGAHVRLTNARFLDNSVQQGVVRSVSSFSINPQGTPSISGVPSNSVTINGAEFQNNRIDGDSILDIQTGSLTLQGHLVFGNNPSALLGGQASRYTLGSRARLTSPKKKKKEEVRPTLTATPRPRYAASYTALQTATGMTFEATYGLDSGVHFRQLDGAGIGIQSIIDAGYLAALDVYGYVEQGVEVCFPQAGRVIFLDARTIPRAITTLPATARDGMTCVYLNSPGSLVLLPPN